VWEVFSELHNEVEEIIEVRRRRHAREQKTHGRMRHTELETHFRWAVVWRLKDGKVLSAHGYMTKAQALDAASIGS
jgi:ketosteroid isomerase-like protein